MDNQLIFDIGMHRGEDTEYYLTKGYTVVAVDADPELVELAKEKFSQPLTSAQLTLENVAISDQPGHVDFYLSKNTLWNSLNPNIADRLNYSQEKISIPANTLENLFKKHGVPYYCKIDIEGYDLIAIRGLSSNYLPSYISVESECVGENEELTNSQCLATLDQLYRLGYNQFKLVDQQTLHSLKPQQNFYKKRKSQNKFIEKLSSIFIQSHKQKLGKQYGYRFPPGATGPFGEDIAGNWYSYSNAKEMLLHHRKQFFDNQAGEYNFSFWCDWHAKK